MHSARTVFTQRSAKAFIFGHCGGRPGRSGVHGDPKDMYPPGSELPDEGHIQPLERDCLNLEEVRDLLACTRKNVRQVGPSSRSGAGGIR